MENTRSKNRKHKNYAKQKLKSAADDVDEKEPHIFSSVDKIRPGRLATTPVSPVGNIVDMQGSLDHGNDKNEEEKSENKSNNKKDGNKDSNECSKAADNQETNKEENRDDKDASSKDVKNEMETGEGNDGSENVDAEGKTVADTKSVEKEDAINQKSADETCESSGKQSIAESQGTWRLHDFTIG